MSDVAQTLVRSVFKIGGGLLIAKGFTDEAHLEVIIGGLIAAANVLWGIYHQLRKKPSP